MSSLCRAAGLTPDSSIACVGLCLRPCRRIRSVKASRRQSLKPTQKERANRIFDRPVFSRESGLSKARIPWSQFYFLLAAFS